MKRYRNLLSASAALVALFALLAPFAGCGSETTQPQNGPPRIVDVVVNPASVVLGGTTRVTGLISDPNGDSLTVRWEASGGTFADSTLSSTSWTAPQDPGTYTLSLFVTDGRDTVDRSADVIAGNAVLTVVSDPPGVLIDLDGVPTGKRTPHTFDPVPAGFRTVVISDLDFSYDRISEETELAHGMSDTLRFTYRRSNSAVLNLGRSDFLEIGGVAYLRTGTGIVYAARTADGTGLFNSAINAPTGSPNGIRLLTGVSVSEPVTVSDDGNHIVFVSEDGRLLVATVSDIESNGIIDEVTDIRALDNLPKYGPALSATGQIAYTRSPSDEPAVLAVFTAEFRDSVIVNQVLSTTTPGRRPVWAPEDSDLAYEKDGVILHTTVIPGSLIPADTLTDEGFNTSPAWGGWGDNHLAFLRGNDEAALDRVMLGSTRSEYQVPLYEGLSDPRYLAWSPTQVAVVASHNPAGGGEILLLFGLPVP